MTKLLGLFTGMAVVALIAVFAVVFALPTMLLWNWALEPAVDGIHQIGFFQAMGINLLASILFKGASATSSK